MAMAMDLQVAPGVPHRRMAGAASDALPSLHALVLANLTAALDLLAGEPAAIHQGVHQARKRLRRVRAALALGAPELGPAAQSLDAELGRLCRGLSYLRDAKALVEAIARLSDGAAGAAVDFTDAIALAETRRDAVLATEMARDPDFVARRRRLQRALVIVERLPWPRVDRETALFNLARAERRVAKASKQAHQHPQHNDDWHRLRRRVRRLRQMQALAQAVFGIEAGIHGSSEALATALGEAQDDILIIKHCHSRSPFPAPLRRELRAIAAERIRRARH